ncbi:MAG: hypothetical protein QOG83_170 [Alphaproteobacteria bacterium]|nr:hypothetical protein [Alphaproteobacteria bacterium]
MQFPAVPGLHGIFTAACKTCLPKDFASVSGHRRNRITGDRTAGGPLARGGAGALVALALGGLLGGCVSGVDGLVVFGDPGKYQYSTCEQLAAATKRLADREGELRTLIAKAEREAGGAIISTVAYRTDYVAVQEEQRVIEATARTKDCLTPSTWRSNTVIR